MKRTQNIEKNEQCASKNCCYLAGALDCFGYMADCALYLKSNGRLHSRLSFDLAVDKLIDKTKAKHKQHSLR